MSEVVIDTSKNIGERRKNGRGASKKRRGNELSWRRNWEYSLRERSHSVKDEAREERRNQSI